MAAAGLSLLRIGWDMVNAHTPLDDEGHTTSMIQYSPYDVKLLLRRGIERWQGRRVAGHVVGEVSSARLPQSQDCSLDSPAPPPPTLWVRAISSIVKGARGVQCAREIGALKTLWSGASWERARKHAAGLAVSAQCRVCYM